MEIVSMFRKVEDLTEDERRAVEALLRRKLEAGETVRIRAAKRVVIREAPSGKAREEAFLRFLSRSDETAKRSECADADLDAAIEEATSHVRRKRG